MKRLISLSLLFLFVGCAEKIQCVPKTANAPSKPIPLPVEVINATISGESLMNLIQNWIDLNAHDNELGTLGGFKFDIPSELKINE